MTVIGTIPKVARVVVDVNGRECEIATIALDIPIRAEAPEEPRELDAKYVTFHGSIDPADVERAFKWACAEFADTEE